MADLQRTALLALLLLCLLAPTAVLAGRGGNSRKRASPGPHDSLLHDITEAVRSEMGYRSTGRQSDAVNMEIYARIMAEIHVTEEEAKVRWCWLRRAAGTRCYSLKLRSSPCLSTGNASHVYAAPPSAQSECSGVRRHQTTAVRCTIGADFAHTPSHRLLVPTRVLLLALPRATRWVSKCCLFLAAFGCCCWLGRHPLCAGRLQRRAAPPSQATSLIVYGAAFAMIAGCCWD